MNGILPTRGSIMLDLVFLAMFAVVALLVVSVILAKRGQWIWHRNLQVGMAIVLAVAVTAFEIDMRFVTQNWRTLAEPSPFYESGWVDVALVIHLLFAVPAPIWWTVVIVLAWRRFDQPARPGTHSQLHRKLGWLGVILMVGTSVTGWIFYALAFIAS